MELFAALNKYLLATQLRKLDIVRMLTALSLVTRSDAQDLKWGNLLQDCSRVLYCLKNEIQETK